MVTEEVEADGAVTGAKPIGLVCGKPEGDWLLMGVALSMVFTANNKQKFVQHQE